MSEVIHKRYCVSCKTTENLVKGTLRRSRKSTRQYYRCNSCNTARVKKYRATREGAAAAKRAVDKYNQANKHRVSSWHKAQAKYREAQPCVVCGAERVDRHHPDPQKPLEIVFLCRKHHKDTHKVERSLLSKPLAV